MPRTQPNGCERRDWLRRFRTAPPLVHAINTTSTQINASGKNYYPVKHMRQNPYRDPYHDPRLQGIWQFVVSLIFRTSGSTWIHETSQIVQQEDQFAGDVRRRVRALRDASALLVDFSPGDITSQDGRTLDDNLISGWKNIVLPN